MKKTVLTLVIAFASFLVFSQNPLARGGIQLNAGVGLSSWGIPLYFGADYGLTDDITIGGETSFRTYSENFIIKYHHTVIGVSGNANYHFNNLLGISSEWDTYAGANVGFYFWNSPNNYPGDYASGLGLGLQVGGRYYFTENFGLNLEFGGGNAFSGGKFGISYKL